MADYAQSEAVPYFDELRINPDNQQEPAEPTPAVPASKFASATVTMDGSVVATETSDGADVGSSSDHGGAEQQHHRITAARDQQWGHPVSLHEMDNDTIVTVENSCGRLESDGVLVTITQ